MVPNGSRSHLIARLFAALKPTLRPRSALSRGPGVGGGPRFIDRRPLRIIFRLIRIGKFGLYTARKYGRRHRLVVRVCVAHESPARGSRGSAFD